MVREIRIARGPGCVIVKVIGLASFATGEEFASGTTAIKKMAALKRVVGMKEFAEMGEITGIQMEVARTTLALGTEAVVA